MRRPANYSPQDRCCGSYRRIVAVSKEIGEEEGGGHQHYGDQQPDEPGRAFRLRRSVHEINLVGWGADRRRPLVPIGRIEFPGEREEKSSHRDRLAGVGGIA